MLNLYCLDWEDISNTPHCVSSASQIYRWNAVSRGWYITSSNFKVQILGYFSLDQPFAMLSANCFLVWERPAYCWLKDHWPDLKQAFQNSWQYFWHSKRAKKPRTICCEQILIRDIFPIRGRKQIWHGSEFCFLEQKMFLNLSQTFYLRSKYSSV